MGSVARRSRFPKTLRRKAAVTVSNLLGGPIPGNAIGYAEHFSRSHDAVIRVYDAAGNVIEAHENKGDFKEW